MLHTYRVETEQASDVFFPRQTNGVLSGNNPRDVALVASNATGCYRDDDNDGDADVIGCYLYEPVDPSELPVGTNTTFFRTGDEPIIQMPVFELMNFDWNYTQAFDDGSKSTSYQYPSDFAERLAIDLMVEEDLPGTFDRIANSMTDYLRVTSASRRFSGTTYVQETFVEVDWRWFALPVALVLLAMVVLVASIAMSKKRRPGSLATWKSSSLPLLVYGVDGGWTIEEENMWGSQRGRRSAVEGTLDDVVVRLGVNQEEKLRFIRE